MARKSAQVRLLEKLTAENLDLRNERNAITRNLAEVVADRANVRQAHSIAEKDLAALRRQEVGVRDAALDVICRLIKIIEERQKS